MDLIAATRAEGGLVHIWVGQKPISKGGVGKWVHGPEGLEGLT